MDTSQVGNEASPVTEQDEFWARDKLSRRQEVNIVIDYVLRKLDETMVTYGESNFVLNVDSPWGSGKSFFLSGLRMELERRGHLVAYVDAWETDNVDDPMVPILLEIQRALTLASHNTVTGVDVVASLKTTALFGGKLAIHLAKGATKALGRRYLGDALETLPDFDTDSTANEVVEGVNSAGTEALNSALDKFANNSILALQQQMETKKDFKENLLHVINTLGQKDSKKRQLIVLVDELDRCRPDYAITLLERIKHIFDTPGLAFIVATDTTQLQHSIRAVYGGGFDSEGYLNRFFSRKYHLRKGTLAQLVEEWLKESKFLGRLSIPPGCSSVFSFIDQVFRATNLSARDSKQCLNKLEDFCLLWSHTADVELAYLLPLIVSHHQSSTSFAELSHIGHRPISESLMKRLSSVKIDFGFDHNLERSRKIEGDLLEVWEHFNTVRKMNFTSISAHFRQNGHGAQDWVAGRLRDENQKMRGGGYISNNPPPTVLSEYTARLMSLQEFS